MKRILDNKFRTVLVLGAGLLLYLLWGLLLPARLSTSVRLVELPLGSSVGQIARILHREGAIHSPFLFKVLCRLSGTGARLRAGEYEFRGTDNLLAVWNKLRQGRIKVHYLTFPEGWSAAQVGEHLEQKGLTSRELFLRCVGDPVFLAKHGLAARSGEGFLFPDTYEFIKGMTPEQIAGAMLDRFFQAVPAEEIARAKKAGYTLSQWVILASLVEREAEAKEERGIVASVFINRLKKKIRLESCATVLYALGRSKTRLSYDDLEVDSPYNTYRHRGLPPGPICNPGRAALQSVLEPVKTDYLFFVAKGDGTHAFSSTLEEHVKAKHKYRQKF